MSNIKKFDEFVNEEREFSTKQREKLADKGEALPDGSYPIKNRVDLINAIKSQGRGLRNADEKRKRQVLAHIKKRANDLDVDLEKTENGYWSISEK